MRCARCGNENLDGNRFCGMCGATLLSAPVPSPSQRAATGPSISSAAATPARSQTAEASRGSAYVSDDSPVISGPSFLGLDNPPPRKKASLSIDPQSARPARNLDYLLDDEEEHRGGGGGKVFLILIALALAVGLGYLRWKNHGFPSLSSGTNKPSPVAQNPVPTDADSSAPAPAASNPVPESQPAANQPAATSQPPATAQPPAASPSSVENSAAPPPVSKTPAAVPAATDAPNSDTAKPGSAATSGATSAAASATPDTEAPTTDTKEPEDVASAAIPKKPEKPAPAVRQPAPKPSPASVPARTSADPVVEAQKYLYGRGAAQDCERGMQILKPAANHSNAKAMIEMGALYSAGLCAPHDLPTAYRWFALALRRDPENQEAQADLQKLWGEMTQPERQLAIKLTQ